MNKRVAKIVFAMSIAMVMAAGWMAWNAWQAHAMIPAPGANVEIPPPGDAPALEATPPTPPELWSVFQPLSREAPTGGVQGQFRLAGTFFVMGNPEQGGERQRLAIVDDLVESRQHIVSEGQDFNGYEIVRIYQDRIILRRDDEELELSLSFKTATSAPTGETESASTLFTDPDEVTLESNRFGRRVGETRWVMQKQALVDYYHELLDEPERIAAIYMSLKPDYNEQREITGYQLDPEGEQEFFKAVGLREGDKIRKVNSMNMISQMRAEYFIGEFMQDRLGAVVIDVERDGKPEKLIYLLR